MSRSSGGAGVLSSTGDGHCQWLCSASTNGQANLEAIHPFIVSWHMPFTALSRQFTV